MIEHLLAFLIGAGAVVLLAAALFVCICRDAERAARKIIEQAQEFDIDDEGAGR